MREKCEIRNDKKTERKLIFQHTSPSLLSSIKRSFSVGTVIKRTTTQNSTDLEFYDQL